MDELTRFVAENSGDARWTATLLMLAVLAARAQEVDAIVGAMEGSELDEVGDANRRLLLACLAFEPARRSRQTAAKLLGRAFQEIEDGEWPDVRAQVLRAALASLDDPTAGPAVEARIMNWAPRLHGLAEGLFQALSRWTKAPDLGDALVRALGDEERHVRRSASRALAAVYEGDGEMFDSLGERLAATSDLGKAAAILEALSIGWPEQRFVRSSLEAALASADATMRLVAASGRLLSGTHDHRDREALLGLGDRRSSLHHCDRPGVGVALAGGWPDDSDLVGRSLASLREGSRINPPLDDGTALRYLTSGAPDAPGVAEWFSSRFEQPGQAGEHHLPFIDFDWTSLAPLARSNPELKEAIVRHLLRPGGALPRS